MFSRVSSFSEYGRRYQSLQCMSARKRPFIKQSLRCDCFSFSVYCVVFMTMRHNDEQLLIDARSRTIQVARRLYISTGSCPYRELLFFADFCNFCCKLEVATIFVDIISVWWLVVPNTEGRRGVSRIRLPSLQLRRTSDSKRARISGRTLCRHFLQRSRWIFSSCICYFSCIFVANVICIATVIHIPRRSFLLKCSYDSNASFSLDTYSEKRCCSSISILHKAYRILWEAHYSIHLLKSWW